MRRTIDWFKVGRELMDRPAAPSPTNADYAAADISLARKHLLSAADMLDTLDTRAQHVRLLGLLLSLDDLQAQVKERGVN